MNVTAEDLQAAKELGFQNHLGRPGTDLSADQISAITSEVYLPLDSQRSDKLNAIRDGFVNGD